MPRAKMEMQLIENPKKRRTAFKNRRDGLVQKTSQLSTLCGIDAFLVCFDPTAAGPEGGAAAVTTWPADRQAVLTLIKKYRETPADKIKQSFDTHGYYQEDLAKQQRKLLKIGQCGASEKLKPWDRHLDDLSVADLDALLHTLDETLQRAQRRIVALCGHVHHDDAVPSAAMVAAPTPHAMTAMPSVDYNSFDFAFSLPDAGSVATQYYYPPHEMLPQPFPVQPPCLGLQMPLPPCLSFHMPPPALTAPPNYGMTGTGTMDFLPFATNVVANETVNAAGFYDDLVPSFGSGGVDDDYVLGQAFAAGPAGGAGYQHEHHMPAGVWPMSRLSDHSPMDVADFQLRNDFADLHASCSGSNSSRFQGGFQK